MTSETREIAIGAATFGCLALVMAYLYVGRDLAASASSTDIDIVAKFNRVDGLVEGDEVRLGGIKVGTIKDMRLDKQFRAVLTMTVDGGIPLPTDSSAAIHTDGLFGSKFMVLEPGGEEKYLKPGSEITYTQDAVVVSDLLDLIISEGREAMKKRKQEGK
ncbi:MAG: MCE family protein [Rhodospirillales bacterium]|nr:MCE family protein [Rhodospirillales bacterium]